ncbi:unnamed protein product, partial [Ranitomeya imitator]
MYMETVQKDLPVEFNMNVLMDQRVLNVKSSSATVYRYYEEGNFFFFVLFKTLYRCSRG